MSHDVLGLIVAANFAALRPGRRAASRLPEFELILVGPSCERLAVSHPC